MICTDVDKLVSRVCKARGWSPGEVEVVKIGVDSGQGSLKASMSLLREEDLQPGAQVILCICNLEFLKYCKGYFKVF